MINVICYETKSFGENVYIVYRENESDCLLVDPGAEFHSIKQILDEKGIICRAVLLTHGHFDHIGAVKAFQDLGAKVYIGEGDVALLEDSMLAACGIPSIASKIECTTPDIVLRNSGKMTLFGFDIEFLSTPGHTKGGMCYVIEKNIFSGDTLFSRSIGRTDLPGGDYDTLISSIKMKLFPLKGYKVFPGHAEKTSIDAEIQYNPYINLRVDD